MGADRGSPSPADEKQAILAGLDNSMAWYKMSVGSGRRVRAERFTPPRNMKATARLP